MRSLKARASELVMRNKTRNFFRQIQHTAKQIFFVASFQNFLNALLFANENAGTVRYNKFYFLDS